MKKSFIWILAVIVTMAAAVFQRITGPTYPYKGKKIIGNTEINYSLSRSAETGSSFSVKAPFAKGFQTFLVYKRYKTNDKLNALLMKKGNDNEMQASLPELPAAGKYAYTVYYKNETQFISLTNQDVIVRFKSHVPDIILILHILFMFIGMLFSNAAGIFSIMKNSAAYIWSKWTLLFIIIGGLILGPIVQKYSFGEYWTGVPFGYDLTDNKILLSFIVWAIAFVLFNRTKNYKWILFASLVTFIVFLIPHSLLGSELNYTTGAIQQG